MRYLVITKDQKPFLTKWLMLPDWNLVTMIVDVFENKYLLENDFKEDGEANWNEIEIDHL